MRIFLFLAFVFLSPCSLADGPGVASVVDSNDKPVHVVEGEVRDRERLDYQKAALRLEVESLKKMNAAIGGFHSSILSTVYYCLGAVFSILLLVLGANAFMNFKLHDREVLRLNSFVSDSVENSESRLKSLLRASLAELRQNVARDVDGVKGGIVDRVANYEAENNRLKSQLDSLSTRLESEIRKIKVDLYNAEAEVWGLRGSQDFSLVSISQSIENYNGESPQVFNYFKGKFSRCLGNLISGSGGVEKWVADLVIPMLNRYEGIFKGEVNELISRVEGCILSEVVSASEVDG